MNHVRNSMIKGQNSKMCACVGHTVDFLRKLVKTGSIRKIGVCLYFFFGTDSISCYILCYLHIKIDKKNNSVVI